MIGSPPDFGALDGRPQKGAGETGAAASRPVFVS
jgi:hypothetical protein